MVFGVRKDLFMEENNASTSMRFVPAGPERILPPPEQPITASMWSGMTMGMKLQRKHRLWRIRTPATAAIP